MKIDPNAALSLALGTMGLYIATNKQPPEWLVLTSLMVGIVGITRDAVDLVEPNNAPGMAGLPSCCPKCYNNSLKRLDTFTYK